MENKSGVKLIAVLALIAIAVIISVAPLLGGLQLGLDLQGGVQVVLQAIPDEGKSVTSADMQQLISVMDNRVNELGVSEPNIQQEGDDRLVVELAGVDDPETAVQIIGKTAKLEFIDPDGNVILDGSMLDDSYAQINSAATPDKANEVVLVFNSEGAKIFYDETRQHVGQVIQILLDGEVVSAPQVKQPISGGTAVISGGFATFEEASNIAALLRGGSLPVNLNILSKTTVGPTLGADSLNKSLVAAAIGFTILFLFMILYYRVPGVWACVSLVLYTLILLWILRLLHATLTLTSIAGFILSVGVAVDANIIIYERIREEMWKGKSLRASIESGFKRAFWTIFDSNLTTLIAAIVLYYFGSGTIKGFALTLSVGIITSMFTAIVFTRTMLRWMSETDLLRDTRAYGIDKTKAKQGLFGYHEFHFDFLSKRKIWYAISALVIVPGLIMLAVAGMNQGIDFSGGSIIEVKYDDAVALEDVRELVTEAVDSTPAITTGEDNSFIIKTETLEESGTQTLVEELQSLGSMTVMRNDFIGPTVGKELLSSARWAVLIAGILMLAYITIRFRFNYAVTSIIGLLHDILVIISVFTIFRVEINSYFIAALLTIVGYSINNTIVIFDRIRENSGLHGKMDPKDLINASINETLGRTINTVIAVLILLFSLLLFGGATTKNFILALTVGMFAGFFSSVFIVGSALYDISSRLGFKGLGKASSGSSKKRTVNVKKR